MGHSFSRFNFDERPLVELMAEKIGCRVYVDNDTRSMTYGEMTKGVVKGEKDVIFVNLSWGIGCGLILNGELYTGKSGFSGELGTTSQLLIMSCFAIAENAVVLKQKYREWRCIAPFCNA